MSVFAALYLRSIAETRATRHFATVTAIVSVLMMTSAITRTSIIGFGLGLIFLVLGSLRLGGRRRVMTVIVMACLLAGALFALQGLWSSRFGASSTRAFDRPATWAAGVRMVTDNPLTGTGSTTGQFVAALESDVNYSETSYGGNSSVPHNASLRRCVAGSGLLYGACFTWLTWLYLSAIARVRRRSRERYLVAAAAAGGVTYVVNAMFPHPEISVFMLLIAALAVQASRTRGASDPPLPDVIHMRNAVPRRRAWATSG